MLEFTKENSIATIRMVPSGEDCPNIVQVSAELWDIQKEITHDKDLRVVILTAGKSGIFFGDGSADEDFMTSGSVDDLLSRCAVAAAVGAMDRPVIAAIGGDALGQGLEIALACDLRICTEKSCLGMNQVNSGGMPWDGGTQRLSRLVGKGKALEMILLGETIDAREALRIGLVHKVSTPDELDETVRKMALKMARQSPTSMNYTKEAVLKGMDMTLEQGLRLEADLYYLIHTTQDRTEGIRAFKEKRQPDFTGM